MDEFQKFLLKKTRMDPSDPLKTSRVYNLKLAAHEVSADFAAKHIQSADHLIAFLLAASVKRKIGGKTQEKQAIRIEKMCRLHPQWGATAEALLSIKHVQAAQLELGKTLPLTY